MWEPLDGFGPYTGPFESLNTLKLLPTCELARNRSRVGTATCLGCEDLELKRGSRELVVLMEQGGNLRPGTYKLF